MGRKPKPIEGCVSKKKPYRSRVLSLFLHVLKTIAAVNRSDAGRFERNLCLRAAVGAVNCIQLTLASFAVETILLPCSPAGHATCGFILKSFFSVKLLFLNSPDEFAPAIFTENGLIFHNSPPELVVFPAFLMALLNLTPGKRE